MRILALPEVRAKMAELGIIPVGNTADQYDGVIRDEIAKWSKVIKEAKISVESLP